MKRNERLQTGLGLLGLILIISGAVLYFVGPPDLKFLTAILLGIGLVLVIASSFASARGDEARLFDKRSARYGVSTSIAVLLCALLLVFAAFLSHRHHYRYDLTRLKKFSLSEQTIKVIKNLPGPVAITCFFEETNEKLREVKSLLKEYKYQSDLIDYTFVDPLARPDIVQKFNVTREGTIVFQSGDKREETFGTGEVDLTGSLVRLTRTRSRNTVYFTEGHAELDLDSYDKYTGMDKFKDALKQQDFKTAKISLSDQGGIPDDAAAVIIAGPKVPFLEEELEVIRKYIDNQGRVLVLLDPPLQETDARRAPSFDELLNPLGIKVEPNLVIDTKSCIQQSNGTIPVIRTMGWHQITKDFRLSIVLWGTRSITPLDDRPANVTVDKLAESSRLDEMLGGGSWGEFDLSLKSLQFDQGLDQVGPLIVAVAIEINLDKHDAGEKSDENGSTPSDDDTGATAGPPLKLARLVVLGDADIATNSVFDQLGNSDFLLNSINWLCQEEDLIAIRPKNPESAGLFIDKQGWRGIFIFVFFVPLFFLGIGIFMWWRRR